MPANQLGRYVRTMVQEEGQSQADWGILARNLRTGKTLISFNADKLFLPASNTKLYTTAAALRLLGPQFRFRTPILATGPVSGGVLEGDLLVIGQGDPTWSARFHDDGKAVFRAWADSLKALGITSISGAIIGVDAVFVEQPQGSGWSWDNDAYYYAAQIAGLSFNENVVDVIIVPRPDWQPPVILPSPATAYVQIENRLMTLDTLNNPDSLKVKWDIRRPR
ncbi:MAG: D-alanyl-D-alanine carboxypeptidase, partial [Candidatus Marinimicrobia bacterium]|nr:D-alanyl-D-alanine carboxypeptidase [Candidatus Neomarinimicrobiota bacterium]